jgi:DNA-binding transcriptional regulator YiaG
MFFQFKEVRMQFNPDALVRLRMRKKMDHYAVVAGLYRLGFQCSVITVHRWERGLNAPKGNALAALALLFDVRMEAFFSNKTKKGEWK